MAIFDRSRMARLAERAEELTGFGIRPRAVLERAAVIEREFVELAGDAEDLALHSMDYFGGRPSEMSKERRRRIAQRSRIALKFDPLAGAEAQLLADFAFGKGVPKPTARDEKVQEVIDEAWSDANNEEKLTGFSAQRKLSNELLTSGELFITGYAGGGRFRVGRLDADAVEAVVPDPEDRNRPLWYLVRQRRFRWNFELDAAAIEDEVLDGGGKIKVKYWKHWRNFDDAVLEREQGLVDDDEVELITPPEEKQAGGVVYHVAINQTGEELRGNPPWARSLRFFEAMNVLTEAHVVMAQGASTFVAQRVMKGSPRQVTRAAGAVLGQLSELGAARFDADARRAGMSDAPAAFAPGGSAPPAPGSWWNANENSKLEALNLSSGSAQMAQTAQIVRAPISAAAGFGQHYLGDASSTNLATASTLELPSTMRIESWQEYFSQLFRWFTDRAIEAAVKAGRLGGLDNFPEDGPIGEMRLHEAEDRAKMAKRVGKDLSYEFVMPFPGRRQLPDVQGFVAGIGDSMDPNGVNIPLRRHLLRFAFEQMGIADVGHAVEESIPDDPVEGGIGPAPPPDPSLVDPNAPAPAVPAGSTPPQGETVPRVKRQSTPPGERPMTQAAWLPIEMRPAVDEFEREAVERFRRLVGDAAVVATLGLTDPDPAVAATNGKA